MHHQYEQTFAPRDDVAYEDSRSLQGVLDKIVVGDLARIQQYSQKSQQLRKDYLDKLYDLIGEEHLAKYLKLHKRRVKKAHAAWSKRSFSFEELLRLKEGERENADKSRALLERAGVSPAKVDALRRKYFRRESRAFSKTIPRLDTPQQTPSRAARRYPYTMIIEPPYSFHRSDVFKDYSGEEGLSIPTGQAHADSFGYCSGESLLRVNGAGDDDTAYVYSYARIGDECRLKANGDVLISAKLETYQDMNSWFYGDVARECFSVNGMEVYADALIQVLFVNLARDYFEVKWSRLTDGERTPVAYDIEYPKNFADGFGSWDFNWWDIGTVVYATQMAFGGPNQQDDRVAVYATLWTVNKFTSNDFTMKSGLRHLYRLAEIRLRQM